MINIYAAREPGELMLRTGKSAANLEKALERARRLRAHKVEVRDDSQHYTQRLVACFVEGVQIAAP